VVDGGWGKLEGFFGGFGGGGWLRKVGVF